MSYKYKTHSRKVTNPEVASREAEGREVVSPEHVQCWQFEPMDPETKTGGFYRKRNDTFIKLSLKIHKYSIPEARFMIYRNWRTLLDRNRKDALAGSSIHVAHLRNYYTGVAEISCLEPVLTESVDKV
jgi:hypothetical protein